MGGYDQQANNQQNSKNSSSNYNQPATNNYSYNDPGALPEPVYAGQ
jgi:hypothetical protein